MTKFLQNGIRQAEEAVKNAVGEDANLFFKNIGDVLDQLPRGFIGIPWFQLKTMLNFQYDPDVKRKAENLPKKKIKKQDKKFLNEISREKEYLEVNKSLQNKIALLCSYFCHLPFLFFF